MGQIGQEISSIVMLMLPKARELLGYNPEWSFERGIKAAIEWYLSGISGFKI